MMVSFKQQNAQTANK